LGSNDVWVGSLFGIFIFRQRMCSHMWMPAGVPKLIGKAGQIVIVPSWAFSGVPGPGNKKQAGIQ